MCAVNRTAHGNSHRARWWQYDHPYRALGWGSMCLNSNANVLRGVDLPTTSGRSKESQRNTIGVMGLLATRDRTRRGRDPIGGLPTWCYHGSSETQCVKS